MFQRLKPDLVVLADDAALMHLGPRLANTRTPGVYLGINANPRSYIPGATDITGVLERPLFKRDIATLTSILHGKFHKALVLFDTDMTSAVLKSELFGGRRDQDIGSISVRFEMIGNLDIWKNTVLSAKTDGFDAIILGLYHTLRDRDGKNVDSEEVLEWTSRNSPVPLFAFWDFTVGREGAIGGLVLAGEAQGRIAGEMILKILSGTPPSAIPPAVAEQGRLLFSRSQLARWSIILPEDIAAQAEYVE